MPGARGVETAAGRRMGLCLVSASVHVSAAAEFLREYMGYLDMGDPLQAFIAGRMYERIEELARLAADMDGVTMDRGGGRTIPCQSAPTPKRCLASLSSARLDLQCMVRGRSPEDVRRIQEAVRALDSAMAEIERMEDRR